MEIDKRTLENIIDLPTNALIDLFKKNLGIADDSKDISIQKTSNNKAYTSLLLANSRGSAEAKELLGSSFGMISEQQLATDMLSLDIIATKIAQRKEAPPKTIERLKPIEGLLGTSTPIPAWLRIKSKNEGIKTDKTISGYVNLYAKIVLGIMITGAVLVLFTGVGEAEWLRALAYSLEISFNSFKTFITVFRVTLAVCILISGALNYIFIKAIARMVEASEIVIAKE